MDFKDRKRKQNEIFMPGYKNHYNKQDRDTTRISSIANSIFKKSFTIINNEKYTLPEPQSMFKECAWNIEKLQDIKLQLNETKSKLNCYNFAQWHQHTSHRNKAKDVEWRVRRDFEPEFVTQAWCKFHEVISKYPLIPKENIYGNNNVFNSLHLCEAPGAFITCLNHWLKTNLPTVYWDWLAMTFNPYYEGNSYNKMISDDRFIMYTLHNWFFGSDNTGDLMSLENLDALIEKARKKGKISLITADGSVSCMNNPGEQEGIVASLHFCEVIAAINILQQGGNFLLKIFTIFEHQSICLIYFISCIFKKIHFYKPVTSKEGNSEVYMICLDYKGIDFVSPYLSLCREQYGKNVSTAMFRKNDIPESFIEQIVVCAQIFKTHQCEVIESNIAAYNPANHNSILNYNEKKIAKVVADKFITDFPIQKLHADLQIVGNAILRKMKNNHWVVEAPAESFNEIQEKQTLGVVEHLFNSAEYFASLEPTIKTFNYEVRIHIYFSLILVSVYSFSAALQPSSILSNIWINIGKPYSCIKSSRFCSVRVSEIYNLIFQTISLKDNQHLSFPTDEIMASYEIRLQTSSDETVKILKFHYTEIYDNNVTISLFKRVISSLQVGDDLFVFGFLLLTQFHGGIVYLLAHTFENVEFTINEEVGCIIHFKCFKNHDLVLTKLEQIHETQDTAALSGKVILSIISVMELYSKI